MSGLVIRWQMSGIKDGEWFVSVYNPENKKSFGMSFSSARPSMLVELVGYLKLKEIV